MTSENSSQENAINNSHNPEYSQINYKDIIRWTLPCWYEISWEESTPALIIKTHRNFVDKTSISPKAPIVSSFQDSLNVGGFSGDLNGNFGFNEVLKSRGETDEFFEHEIEIPNMRKVTEIACERCSGTGENEIADICIGCEGEGKEVEYIWDRADQISTSLNILACSLSLFDKNVDSTFPQLLTFEVASRRGYCGISGEISIPLKKWLASSPDKSHLTEIVSAMKTAYKKMYGQNIGIVREHSFDVRINDGGLIINCPGNACGIHPSDWHFKDGEGYKFSSHNVDTPAQQLTLLVGLASLHDIARKEISLSCTKL